MICIQIMERILLSSKKTGLHDDVLQIINLHLDPLLPLPRLRMISVAYFYNLICIRDSPFSFHVASISFDLIFSSLYFSLLLSGSL